jgi:ABC-type transport system involved in cytochrome c biogenesis permease subunit
MTIPPFLPFLESLAKPWIVFYTMLWLMMILVLGTVAQRYVGLYAAQETFFYSWILWMGVVPTPGGLSTMLFLAVGLLAKLTVKTTWERRRWGTALSHLGTFILMVGGVFTLAFTNDGHVTLFQGDVTKTARAYDDHPNDANFELPFSIELLAFDQSNHPGTAMAKSYQSTIRVDDGQTTWDARVTMNAPFRYKGYTIYQESVIHSGDRVATQLAVVKNDGRLFPYLASFVLCAGLLIHFILRTFFPVLKTAGKMAIIALCLLPLAWPAHAAQAPINLSAFSTLAIQDQGRVKPMDTFARSWLETFSGHDTVDGRPAIDWMAAVIFAPQTVQNLNIFKIQNPAVVTALGLAPRTNKRYSVTDLIPAIDRTQKTWVPIAAAPPENLDRAQKQLLETLQNVDSYLELAHSLTDTPYETKILRVIPPFGPHDTWHTPSTVPKQKGQTTPPLALQTWHGLAVAYRAWDQTAFDQHVSTLTTLEKSAPNVTPWRLRLEMIYNITNPFLWSMVVYILASALAVAAMLRQHPYLPRMAQGATLVAIALHGAGILTRMVILGRPPVTNLYDSILFVGITMVIIGLITTRGNPRHMVFILTCAFGAFLQQVGLKFDAEGDTLRVLIAVLDTNFWLSTHVVMITIGYATSILAALMAHGQLGIMAHTGTIPDIRATRMMTLLALFATTTGTILGGVWADQSWGRFWGWDPKENGALLIILWIIWALHARISGHFKDIGFLATIAALNIIVACAWLGVNLLGVGLHSYGFTQTALVGFTIFCVGDAALIATLYIAARLRLGGDNAKPIA